MFSGMSHTNKRTTGHRPSKRAGGRLGDQFREKLKRLVIREGSQRAFAKKLRVGGASEVDYSPRVGEWLAGKNLPGFESLQRIASVCDVSVDWLFGFDVGQRLTDREPVGELSRALVDHVLRIYETRADSRRRDGLAHVLGGILLERQSVPPHVVRPTVDDTNVRDDDWPKVLDTLPDGRIVTNRSLFGLQLLEVDAQAFLSRVADRVVTDADVWEQENQEIERSRVREDVLRLLAFASEVAEAEGAATGTTVQSSDVLERLLHAALNPLEPSAQANILILKESLAAFRKKRESLNSLHAALAEDIAAILNEQRRRSRGGRGRAKRAKGKLERRRGR